MKPSTAKRTTVNTRAVVRARAWTLAGSHAPDHDITADKPLAIDLDASLLTAHSEKELAAPTYQRGLGFSPHRGLDRPR